MDDITGFRRGRLGGFFLHKRGVRRREEKLDYLFFFKYGGLIRQHCENCQVLF